MGSSSSQLPLQPQQVPLGVFPYFIQPQEITLKLSEKAFSWSGDDFNITDVNGMTWFKMKGQAMSFRDRKVLKDAQGQPILNIENKLLSLHRTFNVYSGETHGDNNKIFTVKSHFSIGGTKMDATFKNVADGREIVLDVRGDWLSRSAEISLDGHPIARVSRKRLNMNEIVFDQQTYFLTVAPGVDLALMCTICVCLDEKSAEGK